MRLPFEPPVEPMLAKASDALPEGDGWLFEPKWDGFRALVFRDGDEVYTQSRDLKPLDRYFPELAAPFLRPAAGALRARRRGGDRPRRRPGLRGAAAADPPGRVAGPHARRGVAGLVRGLGPPRAWATRTCAACRRASGEPAWWRCCGGVTPPIHLTPATTDRALAADWFDRFEGAGLDGVVAKRLDGRIPAGQAGDAQDQARADGGLRRRGVPLAQERPGTHVGSLLLGLFDDEGRLHHVGITSSFTWERRAALVEELAPLRDGAIDGHPWAEWAEWASAGTDGSGQRLPGATLALEPGQGPLVGAAALRARRRGGLRPSPGRPLPPRHDVQALASRQAARGLPLRPARDVRALRAGADLRRRLTAGCRPAARESDMPVTEPFSGALTVPGNLIGWLAIAGFAVALLAAAVTPVLARLRAGSRPGADRIRLVPYALLLRGRRPRGGRGRPGDRDRRPARRAGRSPPARSRSCA